MKRISIILLSAATSLGVLGCGGDSNSPGDDTSDDPSTDDPGGPDDEWDQELAKREYDYNAALRTASLRLKGELPSMAEIKQVADAADQPAKKAAYDALVGQYVTSPQFSRQMLAFWRDTFKMGGTPEMDAAPAFAATLTVENRDYTELFKAATGACPTVNADNTFTAADCPGTGPKVGVLSNPGAMKQYYGNFAFRRVKWVEETFDCTKFPIDQTGAPQNVGAATPYVGSFPFDKTAGKANGGRVDFLDVASVLCNNCHNNINHQAPLFANFDENGVFQNQISVRTPLPMEPLAVAGDYLVPGEPTAWRAGQLTPDLASYGQAMAADPDIAKCAVARTWNWAMGKGDIVDALLDVPPATIQAQLDAFTQSGFKMRDLIVSVFTADDFVKF